MNARRWARLVVVVVALVVALAMIGGRGDAPGKGITRLEGVLSEQEIAAQQ